MKSLLVLLVMLQTAYADTFPSSGPCDDVEACEKACAKNQKGTCYYGGVLVLQTAKEERWERAQKLFERACVKGDPEGCYQAANSISNIEYNESKKSDGPKSFAAYKRACSKNHARACFTYASLLTAMGDDKSKKLATATEAKGNKLIAQRCLKQNMVKACSWGFYLNEDKDPKLADKLRAHGCKLDANTCP